MQDQPGVVLLAMLATGLLVLSYIILCSTPGKIARKQGRPEAALIGLLGWAGVIIWPLLIVAFILLWIPRRPRTDPRDRLADRALGFPVKVLPVVAVDEGRTRFRISGVVRATGTDIKTYIEAASRANALVKAELKGIVATEIEQA